MPRPCARSADGDDLVDRGPRGFRGVGLGTCASHRGAPNGPCALTSRSSRRRAGSLGCAARAVCRGESPTPIPSISSAWPPVHWEEMRSRCESRSVKAPYCACGRWRLLWRCPAAKPTVVRDVGLCGGRAAGSGPGANHCGGQRFSPFACHRSGIGRCRPAAAGQVQIGRTGSRRDSGAANSTPTSAPPVAAASH